MYNVYMYNVYMYNIDCIMYIIASFSISYCLYHTVYISKSNCPNSITNTRTTTTQVPLRSKVKFRSSCPIVIGARKWKSIGIR